MNSPHARHAGVGIAATEFPGRRRSREVELEEEEDNGKRASRRPHAQGFGISRSVGRYFERLCMSESEAQLLEQKHEIFGRERHAQPKIKAPIELDRLGSQRARSSTERFGKTVESIKDISSLADAVGRTQIGRKEWAQENVRVHSPDAYGSGVAGKTLWSDKDECRRVGEGGWSDRMLTDNSAEARFAIVSEDWMRLSNFPLVIPNQGIRYKVPRGGTTDNRPPIALETLSKATALANRWLGPRQ
ncbi:hypothetical protein DFH06DRAFT_1305987 [Mycena polygramma]|nr:hypothetical protein DFH06DRAFT_1305987 [Mycena polygramma]